MKHLDGGDEIVEQASLYALGALTVDEASAFEAHLEAGCAACAAELEPAQLVVSVLGLASPPLDPPARARERFLARLGPAVASRDYALDSFVTVRADQGEWRQAFEGVSVKQLFVDRERGTVTSLYKVGPGARIPPHTHEDFEQCLVIEGDFLLNHEIFGPGDFTCALAGSVHQVSFSVGGALLLIVASSGSRPSLRPEA